jgi:hypothetical protein
MMTAERCGSKSAGVETGGLTTMGMTDEPDASGEPEVNPTAGEPLTGDPMVILSSVPRDAQLFLRDYIAGLEAQAGTARAAADRTERACRVETDRLVLLLAGARSERDAAVAERDAALRTVTQLSGGVDSAERGLLRRIGR